MNRYKYMSPEERSRLKRGSFWVVHFACFRSIIGLELVDMHTADNLALFDTRAQ